MTIGDHDSAGGAGVEHTRLGRTGLRVSRIGLGCMSYGRPEAGMHRWTLALEDAVAALGLRLTGDEVTELEAPYRPQDNYWW